ncbi:hypothetical protein BD769DRAFT_1394377 [Suillus cothurnatus]|nr:hypothetical protein BD769DRAFT_1394377 [Suillus cothurnatus]
MGHCKQNMSTSSRVTMSLVDSAFKICTSTASLTKICQEQLLKEQRQHQETQELVAEAQLEAGSDFAEPMDFGDPTFNNDDEDSNNEIEPGSTLIYERIAMILHLIPYSMLLQLIFQIQRFQSSFSIQAFMKVLWTMRIGQCLAHAHAVHLSHYFIPQADVKHFKEDVHNRSAPQITASCTENWTAAKLLKKIRDGAHWQAVC